MDRWITPYSAPKLVTLSLHLGDSDGIVRWAVVADTADLSNFEAGSWFSRFSVDCRGPAPTMAPNQPQPPARPARGQEAFLASGVAKDRAGPCKGPSL